MSEISLSVLFGTLALILLLVAFFSGSETALMALNRYRLKHLADGGHKGAIRAQKLLDHPDRLLGLILIGNTFANIFAAQLATYIGYRLYGDIGIAVATGVLTLALLIFSEVAPKTLGALRSETIAYPSAYIYGPLLRIAHPLVWLINLLANNFLRLLGIDLRGMNSHALSREELRSVLTQASGTLPKRHRNMLLSVLDLEQATVEDIMIPRHEITGIDLEDDWDNIVDQLTHSAYTRLAVYRGSIDHVQGFLHMRKITPLIMDRKLTQAALEATILAPYFIPEGCSLNRLLLNFQRERRRVGLVVDEYGDIQGMATLEDLLEEIVGEFTTDPATFATEIQPQPDGTFLVDGAAHVRDLNRLFGWHFHGRGARTLNGLILERMEMIPSAGTTILIDGYPVEVIQTAKNAVKTARISPRLPDYRPGADHL